MDLKTYTCLQSVVVGGDNYRMGEPITLDANSRQAKQLIKGNIIGEKGVVNQSRPAAAPGASESSSLVGQASPKTTANESANGAKKSTRKRTTKAKAQPSA